MPERARAAADPYATLGLAPGASSAEVKRAYRQLAKAFHPDAAGEAAVPRFLAIQAAYDQLITGRPASRAAAAGPPASSAPPPSPGEPWRADPARARAARERARAGRAGAGRSTGASGGASAEPRSRPGFRSSAGASGTSGTSGAGGPSRGAASGGGRGSRRSTRKATLGSTSYDEARERDPNDASWSGASWYGPSSGEYWIINPREYADPRKHGPEYQRRARQRAADAAAGLDVEPEDIREPEGIREPEPPPPEAHTGTGFTADTSWTMPEQPARPRRWAATRPPAAEAEPARRWAPPDVRRAAPPRRRISTSPRELVGTTADDPIRRLAIALVAWPPIGIAAAFAVGEMTGCNLYSAECTGTEPMLPWLAQAAILGLLLLLPPIARLLAGGTIAILIALVPITMFLLVVGASGAPQAGFALAFLLALAWLVGVGWAAVVIGRRRPREAVA